MNTNVKLKLLGTCLSCLFWSQFAFCQVKTKGVDLDVSDSKNKPGNVFALSIGVSNYSNLPKLQYADRDAYFFREYLKGIVSEKDTANLTLLTNHQASRDAIVDQLYEISDKAAEGDLVFVYFSGHGDIEQLIQTENCLLLLGNSPAKNYLRKSNSYIDINILKEFFQSWSSKKIKVVFICDACHSGSLVGGDVGRKNTLLSLQQSWNNELKLFSCQANEVSLEGNQWGGGRGLFSFYLILGMKGLADKDHNGEISLLELDDYLKDKVSSSSSNAQIPVTQGNLRNVICSYSDKSLTYAQRELISNNSDIENSIVLKGTNGDLRSLIKDSADLFKYDKFEALIKSGNLLEPESYSALAFYKQLVDNPRLFLIKNQLRTILTDALQKRFNSFLDNYYNDDFEALAYYDRVAIEKELKSALDLTKVNSFNYRDLKSKIYFLEACETTSGIMKNSVSYENNRKIEEAISLVNQAILLNDFTPFLYLKLGDLQLNSGKMIDAIESYKKYQKLLPNDENSYNKLGLAYYAKRDISNAIESFKKALKLKPDFLAAQNNLRIAEGKSSVPSIDKVPDNSSY